MASSGNNGGRSDAGGGGGGGRRKSGRFTEEQVEALEIAFVQCPKPSAVEREEIKHLFPVLNNLEDTLLKVWFQNRRNLERQPEDSDVNSIREKLTITNKLLEEEHATLLKKMNELLSENAFLWKQLREDI